MVVGFSYLWASEYQSGVRVGQKDRPCMILLLPAIPNNGHGLVVLPITHSSSYFAGKAWEIPDAAKAPMGLDTAQQWISVSELNFSVWPGIYIRQSAASGYVYGTTPDYILAAIKIFVSNNKSSLISIRRK